MAVIDITSTAQFDEILAKNACVLVDFYATWCGPCNMIAPEIHRLSEQHGSVAFVKVNVDTQAELARRYSISAMPTFMAFKQGARHEEAIMGANKAAIVRLVSSMSPA